MDQLKALGLDDNTLVMFSSDNGTTHLEREVDFEFFESVGPLRGLKGSLYEGGIRVPMIARWPGKIKPGTTTDHLSAFCDVLPTLAEVAGAAPPEGIDGLSFLPTLLGQPEKQKQHEYLYWEFPAYGGQQAVRMGPWKAVRQNMLAKANRTPLRIELYNLDNDIGEQQDLADARPEIVQKAAAIMNTCAGRARRFRSTPWTHSRLPAGVVRQTRSARLVHDPLPLFGRRSDRLAAAGSVKGVNCVPREGQFGASARHPVWAGPPGLATSHQVCPCHLHRSSCKIVHTVHHPPPLTYIVFWIRL